MYGKTTWGSVMSSFLVNKFGFTGPNHLNVFMGIESHLPYVNKMYHIITGPSRCCNIHV